MAIEYKDSVRNTMLDALDTAIGTTGCLEIRTGAVSGVDNAPTGTVLVTINLPNPAFGAASAGAIAKNGTWEDTSADAGGTAAHFRIYSSQATKDASTTIMEGTVTATGGGGDLTLDNTTISAGQSVTINTFTITEGNG